MFVRYRTALMEAADPQQPVSAGTPPTPAAPVAPAPTQALPEAMQKLVNSPDAFKARLAEEQARGQAAMLKDLGLKDAGELKTRLDEFKKMQDAQLSEQERAKKQIDDLTPRAARAAALEAAVLKLLEVEEKAIPEDKKGLLELAPGAENPEARLAWIANAKAKRLFETGSPAAAATPVATTPAAPPNPATTIAPPGPVPPSPTGTKSEFQMYTDLQARGMTRLAAQFYEQNQTLIEQQRPKT